MKFKPIQILVLLLHVYALITILYLPTTLRARLIDDFEWFEIWKPACVILTCLFYCLVCKGPRYVVNDEASVLHSEHSDWFCSDCNHYPPVRSGHCRTCKKCVYRKDHHCLWMGTCIGQGNHFYFLLYLLLETVTLIVFMKSAYPLVKVQSYSMIQFVSMNFQAAVIAGFSFLAIIQPIILFPTHLFLALLNRTTWEFMKAGSISYLKNWNYNYSPFSRGLLSNIHEFVTMQWEDISWKVPENDQEIDEWKRANWFLFNDYYECC